MIYYCDCIECGAEFTMTEREFLQADGCPTCGGNLQINAADHQELCA